jgi:hypothetical protein
MKYTHVDDMLLVQQGFCAGLRRKEPSCTPCTDDFEGVRHQRAVYDVSMAWAVRAKLLAAAHCRLSLISKASEDLSCMVFSQYNHLQGACIMNGLAKGVHKTSFHEDRGQYGVYLDVDSFKSTTQELSWLMQSSKEFCCAMRGGHLYGQRLVRQTTVARHRRQPITNQGGTCIVTGGLKGLGLAYAFQLAKGGCHALVLASRSGILADQDLSLLPGRKKPLCAERYKGS